MKCLWMCLCNSNITSVLHTSNLRSKTWVTASPASLKFNTPHGSGNKLSKQKQNKNKKTKKVLLPNLRFKLVKDLQQSFNGVYSVSLQVERLEGFWTGSWDRLAAAWVCCHSEHRAESELVSAGDGRKPESRQGAMEKDRGQTLRKRNWVKMIQVQGQKGNGERQLTD